MKRLWSWWLARCAEEDDARPWAVLRIAVALCLVLDLLRVAQLGLVRALFTPREVGGISGHHDPSYAFDDLLGPTVAGPTLYGISLACFLLVGLGVGGRWPALLGAFAYAQLGHLYPPGDRAIDRMLRTVLLILAFTPVFRCWSLARGAAVRRMPRWAGDLLRTLLVVVYASAGVGKLMTNPDWLALHGTPVLYRVVTDPLAAHIDPIAALAWTWPLRLGGWATIALECTAFFLYTRHACWWALPAIGMHLGIASMMELGMFSWGMLAMYPVILAPWLSPVLDRIEARLCRPTAG